MTAEEALLWDRIARFSIDEQGTQFTFAARLARENGWADAYTLRVINEYKKFLFFCCVSMQGVTPSDAVDQAWHLHLTYTKSYWIRLCQDTLNKQIHHNPTKGGSEQAALFKNYYNTSAQLYKQYFRAEPPADIWKDSKERFSDIKFQRVNLSKFWLVPKPAFITGRNKLYTVAVLAILLFAQQSGWSLIVFPIIIVLVVVLVYRNTHTNEGKKNRQNEKSGNTDSGCGGGDFSSDDSYLSNHHHSGHDGDSGCSSGCSGCSSGCSGCGGD
ncbi:hypothetical protein LT679_17945 [Mucilaginibacter roseus]|uniref:TIGR04222 domain-containing membrane protein n=1 Tax=Mucilaginibacter roseus TaxID=1528868 RepID=A0ABS8U5V2_9SPHI|nr:hypothetical protein [Mucilaginibacter roseus]MCD8742498.1 hypothetical protein [Mucilaginibacter roseus]